jgi:hypothetical protein
MTTNQILNAFPEEITLKGSHGDNQLFIDGKKLSLAKSLKVRNHSPTGFNWGYAGSGCAQSALAILLHYLPKEIAEIYYQDFKFAYIAALPQADFVEKVKLRSLMASIIERRVQNHQDYGY